MEIIRIKYRPVPFLSFHRNFVKRVPTNWTEAGFSDLYAVAKYLACDISDDIFLALFLGIPRRILKYFSEFELWKIAQCITLLESMNPISRFLIPEFYAGKYKFTAPKDKLKDMPFGNFVMFDSFYLDYSKGDKSALDKMTAHLYACDKLKEDELMYDAIKPADYAVKYAIYINYNLVREWLGKLYPYLFVKSKEEKKTGKIQLGKKETNWLPVLDALISGDLANAEKYEQLPMHTVLRKLNNQMKEGYRNG